MNKNLVGGFTGHLDSLNISRNKISGIHRALNLFYKMVNNLAFAYSPSPHQKRPLDFLTVLKFNKFPDSWVIQENWRLQFLPLQKWITEHDSELSK